MMNVVEKFHEEHGEHLVTDDNWIVFEDGARRENSPYGGMWKSPVDPRERARYVLVFHRTKWERAREALITMRDAMAISANGALAMGYSPNISAHDAKEKLSAKKKELNKLKRRYKRAAREYEDLTPESEKRREANEAAAAQRHADLHAVLAEFQSL